MNCVVAEGRDSRRDETDVAARDVKMSLRISRRIAKTVVSIVISEKVGCEM